jgi:phage-related protein
VDNKNKSDSLIEMAKTRKAGRGIFGFLMRPVSAILQGTKGVVRKSANTARNVVSRGINGVDSIGRTVTGAANGAIRNVNPFKGRGRNSRKSRRSSRRSRR